MGMFSICNNCGICRCGGCCFAGNGDDDYVPATKEQVIERLDKNQYPSHRNMMIKYLKEKFNYEYKEK